MGLLLVNTAAAAAGADWDSGSVRPERPRKLERDKARPRRVRSTVGILGALEANDDRHERAWQLSQARIANGFVPLANWIPPSEAASRKAKAWADTSPS
ncbi:hypothetical protein PG991_015958 [Apiospora marii]|uniref:Uncharacterized protein n=1 Tax=Apiospora marii TaxID=335849 RepID=A0ABR1R079_9PEZI